MTLEFLYSLPTSQMALVFIAVFLAFALIAQTLVFLLVPLKLRQSHNDFVGLNSAMVGMVFAVLLGFIAVAAWEAYGKAGDSAAIEASLAGDIFRDATLLPEPLRTQLLGDMHEYVEIVIKKEWPAMGRNEPVDQQGWAPLEKFHKGLMGLKSSDPIQVALFSEIFARVNQLYDARRARLSASQDHVDNALWTVVLVGVIIMIGFSLFMGMESIVFHYAMTAVVAITFALMIALIFAFDFPFRGEVQIGPDQFETVLHNMELAGVVSNAN